MHFTASNLFNLKHLIFLTLAAQLLYSCAPSEVVTETCNSNCAPATPSATNSSLTFTNAGATGRFGPTQAQIDAAYGGTNLEGKVTVNSQGIQEWTVPGTGTYRIEVWGAKGGTGDGRAGGSGVKIVGDVALQADQVLQILVGQQATNRAGTDNNSGGAGGGGTFVVNKSDLTPIIVAGGGGGGALDCAGSYAKTSTSGSAGGGLGGAGGVNGGGGGAGQSGAAGNGSTAGGVGNYCSYGAGGGGFYSSGGQNCQGLDPLLAGYSFLGGGFGGSADDNRSGLPGGFGGGAGVGHRAAGGGGYSGGGGDGAQNAGGGGGSFVSNTTTLVATSDGKYNGSTSLRGATISDLKSYNAGDGKVVISYPASAGTSGPAVGASEIDPKTNGSDCPELLAGFSIVESDGTTTVNESGSQDTFTVVLNTQPTGNVVIDLDSPDTTEMTISPASMTFTVSDWNIPQTVTVTGVLDVELDDNVDAFATLNINTGSTLDANYLILPSQAVTVTTSEDPTLVLFLSFSSDTFDSSGSGNHGTAVNTSFTTDRFTAPNSAMSFNGSAYVSVANDDSLNFWPNDDFTVHFWVQTGSCNNGGAESVLLAKFDDSGPGPDNAPFAIVCDTGGEVRAGHYAVGYEDLQINSGTKIEGTTFHSIAFSKNNGILELFIDGVSTGQTTATMTPNIQNNSPLFIGGLNSTALPLTGVIDDVRIYRRALTTSEITILANDSR